MRAFPVAQTVAPSLPFKYLGGEPALDLVNTVDWTMTGLADDRLTDYGRLVEWAVGSGSLEPRRAAELRRMAAEDPRRAERTHHDALALRWLLRRVFIAVASNAGLAGSEELATLDSVVRETLGRLGLAATARGTDAALRWRWRDAGRLDAVLWPVVRNAAEVLTSQEASRIRECAGQDCGWMYVDRSRNGLRRWCAMETCGTREKSRQRARRRSGGGRLGAVSAGKLPASEAKRSAK